jgi:hypothetical protein
MDMLVNHQPGSIFTHAGDLDNRIKTLFDALRVPRGKDEIQHYQPTGDCCYCLMEDDALIDTLAVRMKRLNEAQPDPQFVRLHINVTVRGITPGFISDVF